MKRALIACGGTGGHMSPGIALAEELLSGGWHCTLLISNKQVDSRLVQKYSQFDYETIDGRAFSSRPDRLLLFLVSLLKGALKCRRMIRRSKPDVVIGFGGFLSLPAMLAGYLSGLPTVIHEANRVAGRVTRIVSRFARIVYLPQGVTLGGKASERIRFLGMPVRREIQPIPKEQAKAKLGFEPSKRLLLVMGGSQGAQALNDWTEAHLNELADLGVQVYCLTGGNKEDAVKSVETSSGSRFQSIFRSFSDEMALNLSAADLVVSRSGAGSIAEMLRCRVPGILIPFPFSADDHQIANAEEFERLGCGTMVMQENLSELAAQLKVLILDDSRLQEFESRLEAADFGNVQQVMAQDLEALRSGRQEGKRAEVRQGLQS